MDFIIFEENTFWSVYFLETMFTLSLVVLSVYLFISRKEKKQNGWFGISVLVFSIFLSVLLVLPKTLDIKRILLEDYVVYTGILTESTVRTTGNSENGKYETKIVVDDENFYIKGNHTVFEDILDNELTIYYLPNSKHVLRVDVFLPMKGDIK